MGYPPVHVSTVDAFEQCARRWYLTDPDWGLGYWPRKRSKALFIGGLVHSALEGYYRRGENLVDAWQVAFDKEAKEMQEEQGGGLWPDQQEMLDETKALCPGLLRGYLVWQSLDSSHLSDANLRHLEVEGEFEVCIDVGISMLVAGRWDGVVQHTNGGYYLFETKTARSIPELMAGLPWDPQPRIYLWAAEQVLGIKLLGVIYNILEKHDPYRIPILKSGLPSKAVRSTIRTTYWAYKETLLAALDSKSEDQRNVYLLQHYADSLFYLSTSAPPIYSRYLLVPTEKSITRTLLDFDQRQEQMIEARSYGLGFPASRNRFRCAKCVARHVCLAMDEGRDYQALLGEGFVNDQSESEEQV